MSNQRQRIRELLEFSEQLEGGIPFKDVVEVTSGKIVESIDMSDEADLLLISEIEDAARSLIDRVSRANRRYQANRANEVGSRIENEFIGELRSTRLTPKQLGQSGYPDLKVECPEGRIVYIESKVTSRGWDASMRSFYYSSGRKVEHDAPHLLIGWRIEETDANYWDLKGWKLTDVSKLTVNLKNEFNATNKDIYASGSVLKSG